VLRPTSDNGTLHARLDLSGVQFDNEKAYIGRLSALAEILFSESEERDEGTVPTWDFRAVCTARLS
jgi:hypothetical protein